MSQRKTLVVPAENVSLGLEGEHIVVVFDLPHGTPLIRDVPLGISLTKEEARSLAADLADFAKE